MAWHGNSEKLFDGMATLPIRPAIILAISFHHKRRLFLKFSLFKKIKKLSTKPLYFPVP